MMNKQYRCNNCEVTEPYIGTCKLSLPSIAAKPKYCPVGCAPCNWIEDDEIISGIACTKCKTGRIALMSTFVGCADLDDEPYTNGVAEGSHETITFEDYVSLSIHACDGCGHVFDVFVE